MDTLNVLLRSFFPRNGTTESEIKRIEDTFNCYLPSDYRNFMLQTNGGEGFIAEGGYLELTPSGAGFPASSYYDKASSLMILGTGRSPAPVFCDYYWRSKVFFSY